MTEKYLKTEIDAAGRIIQTVDCPVCENRGTVIDKNTRKERTCVICNGKGRVIRKR